MRSERRQCADVLGIVAKHVNYLRREQRSAMASNDKIEQDMPLIRNKWTADRLYGMFLWQTEWRKWPA